MAQLKRNPLMLIPGRREASPEVCATPKAVSTPASKSAVKPRMRLDENGKWVGATLADRNLISILAQKAEMVVQLQPLPLRVTEKAPVALPSARDVATAKKAAHAKMKVAPVDAQIRAFELLQEKGISAALAFLHEEFWQVWQVPGLGDALDKARVEKATAEQASREAARAREAEALWQQGEALRFRKEHLLGGEFDPRAAACAPRTEPGHPTNDPGAQQQLRKEMRGTTGGGGGNNRQGQKKNKGEKNKKNDGKWK